MPTRALVLGGGGITGVAWETGVLFGLLEAGIDFSNSDLLVGTSAGSVVAAQLGGGRSLEESFELQLAPGGKEIPARFGVGLILRFAIAALRSRGNPSAFRARIGHISQTASTVPPAERRAAIEARLTGLEWSERRLVITAIEAQTGELRTLDRDSGVTLVEAVGASCAVPGVWPPVLLHGKPHMDGGIRSSTNADLAAGHDRIVVIAPIARGFGPMTGVQTEAAELRRTSQVTVVTPNEASARAIGSNVFDPARRAPAARAGRAQAIEVAPEVAKVWK